MRREERGLDLERCSQRCEGDGPRLANAWDGMWVCVRKEEVEVELLDISRNLFELKILRSNKLLLRKHSLYC